METDPAYEAARKNLFRGKPDCAIVEFVRSGRVVTLAAFESGDASLYFSNGGAILGGIDCDGIRGNASELFRMVRAHAGDMRETNDFLPPSEGKVVFYSVSEDGARAMELDEERIKEGSGTLAPAYMTAQILCTNIMLTLRRRGI